MFTTADAVTDSVTYAGIIHLEGRTEERALKVVPSSREGKDLYFRHGNNAFTRSWYHCINGTMGKNGCMWIIDDDTSLLVWSYDLTPEEGEITAYVTGIDQVKDFIPEGTGSEAVSIGYITLSGEEYDLPSFEEVKEIVGVDSSIPEPSYVPLKGSATLSPISTHAPTSTPTQVVTQTPSQVPTQTPTLTQEPTQIPATTKKPTPVPTTTQKPTQLPTITEKPSQVPTVTKKPTQAPAKVQKPAPTSKPTPTKKSIVKKTKATIYTNNKLSVNAVLKNGTLTWKKGMKKAKTFKKVKCFGIVEKSKNCYFMDKKKGAVWQLSYKTGKKKRFIKKSAKKFVYKKKDKNMYLVGIRTASKQFNMKKK